MFKSEADFEGFIRKTILERVTALDPRIYCLNNKKAVDILVCDDREPSWLSFIEVKYHRASHGRLGFGSAKGGGFQPEILTRQPSYFCERLIWVLASETHNPDQIVILKCAEASAYVAGGQIGEKFNNFQSRLWREAQWHTHAGFEEFVREWLMS